MSVCHLLTHHRETDTADRFVVGFFLVFTHILCVSSDLQSVLMLDYRSIIAESFKITYRLQNWYV